MTMSSVNEARQLEARAEVQLQQVDVQQATTVELPDQGSYVHATSESLHTLSIDGDDVMITQGYCELKHDGRTQAVSIQAFSPYMELWRVAGTSVTYTAINCLGDSGEMTAGTCTDDTIIWEDRSPIHGAGMGLLQLDGAADRGHPAPGRCSGECHLGHRGPTGRTHREVQ